MPVGNGSLGGLSFKAWRSIAKWLEIGGRAGRGKRSQSNLFEWHSSARSRPLTATIEDYGFE